MSNLTFMEGDTFSNLDINSTETEYHPYKRSILYDVLYVLTDILKLLTCVASVGASIFLIYVISKFNRLKTKTNIFFLHYAIACCADMIFVPLFMIIYEFLFRHWFLLCAAYNGSAAVVIMVFTFATAINFYWFLQTFKTEWLQNCQRFQLLFTIGLYIFCFIKFIIYVSECFVSEYEFTNYLIIAVYTIMLTITIAINIFTYKRGLNEFQRQTQYQLFISTYIIISYFPFFLWSEILIFVGSDIYLSAVSIYMLIYTIFELFAYSGPIVVVYLLGKKNKYFKAAYNKVFKRSVRNYEDEFDEDSEHEPAQDSNQTSANGLINSTLYAVSV